MKIAVIKLGSRVSIESTATSGGTGEALSIIKMLVDGDASVDVYTKVLDRDKKPELFNIFDIESNYSSINTKGYDCLVVLNGNVNYFGGVDSPSQTLNYWIINNFNGRVYYILCDCSLLLTQIWPSISKKSWSDNYDKSDINITRDDIIYVTQAYAVDKVLEKARKNINIEKAIHYPFEKFPMLTLNYLDFNQDPSYDLSYGGTFRQGKREVDMVKFYFGYPKDIRVEMFGKIKLSNFKEKNISGLNSPEFSSSVNYDRFSDKMLNSRATIAIGDPLYKVWDDIAQRIYESIMIGNVVFIDKSYDSQRRVFKNKELKDFNYISDNKKEIVEKIKKIRDNNYRKYIIDLQREDVKIDTDKYCKDFVKLLEDNK